MAYYSTSALLAAQAKIAPAYNAAELRERQNPILSTGLAAAPFLLQNVEEIKKSTKRTVKGYQFAKIANGSGSARAHDFTGVPGTSAEITLAWSTFTEEFGISLKQGADNVFSNSEMLANMFKQKMRSLRERIGAQVVTSLHAGRTATSNATVRNGAFNSTNNAFEINNSIQFFNYMKSVMSQHKYYGNLDVVVDSVLDPYARNIAAQGTNNATNLAYQINGLNIMPHDILGVDVAVSAYPDGGVAIACPQYSFSIIPFVEEIYRKGWGNVESYNGMYSTLADDTGLPITYTLRAYSLRADGTGFDGTVDDVKTYFQISADVNIQLAEVTGSETPIYEFALVS